MPLPLIYHEDYSPEFPAEHRFPMDKFRLLRGYMGSELSHEDPRRLGLPWNEALARRTVRSVGGSLLAAELALEHGMAWPATWPAALIFGAWSVMPPFSCRRHEVPS
jgi:hypothetical protein